MKRSKICPKCLDLQNILQNLLLDILCALFLLLLLNLWGWRMIIKPYFILQDKYCSKVYEL